MKLIVDHTVSNQPTLPVRWTLTRSESVALKQAEAEEIHVLLIILYENTTLEERFLIPIERAMHYIPFHRPGKHTVFATIICDYTRKELREFTRKRDRDRYALPVLSVEHNGYELVDRFIPEGILATKIQVVVPAEHFPKEPPVWLKKIANWKQEYPARDQCEFRRRLLFDTPFRALAHFFGWLVLISILAAIFWFAGILIIRMYRFVVAHPWQTLAWTIATIISGICLHFLRQGVNDIHLKFEEIQKNKEERERTRIYDDLYKLLAKRPTTSPSITDLPVGIRTVYLLYSNLKTKVCRPFASVDF